MTEERVLIIGGTSGIGAALADLLRSDVDVVLASRSSGDVRLDIRDEEQVRAALVACAPLHHVVVTAADAHAAVGPIAGFSLAAARAVVDTKLLGPWLVAKHAAERLPPGGSITFTSGFAAARPGPGASITAAVNGGLEAMVRALALDLAPIRVNAVSPGWTDTPLWTTIAGPDRAARLADLGSRLPTGRVARPADIAHAFRTMLGNPHITGEVLHVDGGQRLI